MKFYYTTDYIILFFQYYRFPIDSVSSEEFVENDETRYMVQSIFSNSTIVDSIPGLYKFRKFCKRFVSLFIKFSFDIDYSAFANSFRISLLVMMATSLDKMVFEPLNQSNFNRILNVFCIIQYQVTFFQ